MTVWMYLVFVVVWCVGWFGFGMYWARKRRERRDQQRTQMVTISPQFHTGGLVSLAADGGAAFRAFNQAIKSVTPLTKALAEDTKPVVLEETWSPEKIVAWRVIDVRVEDGDPDGLWLGFPHPDGPTEPVVTPVRHPVGVELHAKCEEQGSWFNELGSSCGEVPGKNCQSGVGYGCGFYAFKTKKQAEGHKAAMVIEGADATATAIACVHLSGKVIEHENGYRAEILEVLEVETPVPFANTFEEARATLAAFQNHLLWPAVVPVILPPTPSANPFLNPSGGV